MTFLATPIAASGQSLPAFQIDAVNHPRALKAARAVTPKGYEIFITRA